MKYSPSKPRPYKDKAGVPQPGRWEVDLRGVLDNGLVVPLVRRVFPDNPSVGKIGMRQAAAQAAEEWDRWNRRGQVLGRGVEVSLPKTGGMKPGHAPTFAQFADDFLAFSKSELAGPQGPNRPSTIESKESILRVHLLPAFGATPMDKLLQSDIDRYLVEKAKTEREMSTIRLHLTYLRRMLSVAEEKGLISRLPKYRLPRSRPSNIQALDPDERERFVKAIPELYSGWRGLMLEIMLKTGLRGGECVSLYPADFKFGARPTIHVVRSFGRCRYGPTKSGRPRTVPLASQLAEAIQNQLDADGISKRSTTHHPFSARCRGRRPLSNKYVVECVRNVGEAAETKRLSPHMLRHTFGSECVRRGVPPTTLMEWMGHADLQTTMRYVHLFAPDHLRWGHLLDE